MTYVCLHSNEKYPIIKHGALFKTFTFFNYANNEDISLKLLPDTYDHKINALERSKFKVTPRYIGLARCCVSKMNNRIFFPVDTSWNTLLKKL